MCRHGRQHRRHRETQAVRGPNGATAVLKVSTTDDHSKNSHDCMADYKLAVTPATGGAPVEIDFLASDGDYGRTLSLRLAGFSRDGKRVLGSLAEGGKYSTTLLFDYHAGDAQVPLVDLKMQFARVAPLGCSQILEVIGTTPNGAMVVESNSEKACGSSRRWLVGAAGSKAQPLPQGASILEPLRIQKRRTIGKAQRVSQHLPWLTLPLRVGAFVSILLVFTLPLCGRCILSDAHMLSPDV